MQRIGHLFVMGAALGVLTALPVRAETLTPDSEISQVTVYPGAALVTRSAKVQLQAGEHSIVFQDIIPNINENSLSVSGQGTAKVKLFGTRLKREYLKEDPSEHVQALEEQIQQLEDEVAQKNTRVQVLNEEKAFLQSIKMFADQQLPKDMVTEMPSAEELESIRVFLVNNFQEVETQKEEIRLHIRDLNEEITRLRQQLNDIKRPQARMQRSIVIDLESENAGGFTVNVSYLVYGVNWRPVYDARLTFDESQVELATFGLVKQTTGEDWENVELNISTAKPTIGGQMPELSPWYLRAYAPGPQAPRGNVDRHRLNSAVQFSAGDAVMEERVVDMPQAPEQEMAIAYAQAESKATSVTYAVERPVSIKADGEEARIPIAVHVFPAQLEYVATPKLSPYAYLIAKVKNAKEGQLLPGQINIFFDGNYVGVSQLTKTIGSEEKFDLSLGPDEGVTVKRKLLEEKLDDTLIGNIPSPNKTTTYAYKLIVENYKSKPIIVGLFDQVPVSQDDKIRVKNVKYTPPPAQKDYRDRQGVLKWSLDLKPGEKKEITLEFAVEHPRDLNVSGL